jgi:hypothetical protein
LDYRGVDVLGDAAALQRYALGRVVTGGGQTHQVYLVPTRPPKMYRILVEALRDGQRVMLDCGEYPAPGRNTHDETSHNDPI